MLDLDLTLKQISLEANLINTSVSTEGFTDKIKLLLQNFKTALKGEIAGSYELIEGNVVADFAAIVNQKPYHKLVDLKVNVTRGLDSELSVWIKALNESYKAVEPVVNKEMEGLINTLGGYVNRPETLTSNLVGRPKSGDVKRHEKKLFNHLKSHRKDQVYFGTIFKNIDSVTDASMAYKELLESRATMSTQVIKQRVDTLTELLDKLSFWISEDKPSLSPAVAKQLGTYVQNIADYVSFYSLIEQELLIVQSGMQKLITDFETA